MLIATKKNLGAGVLKYANPFVCMFFSDLVTIFFVFSWLLR